MIKVIGLIQLNDLHAFEEYRSQVGQTVEQYGGIVAYRGKANLPLWNELACAPFDAVVELEFPNLASATAWSTSAQYQNLVPVRSKAMKLTLFTVSE
jgi:uncharacterized protein (DUF1330 family)